MVAGLHGWEHHEEFSSVDERALADARQAEEVMLAFHVLVAPVQVSPEHVDRLFRELFPAAEPFGEARLRLGDAAALHGPLAGRGGTRLFQLVVPAQRGERPDPDLPDADGLYRLFPAGMPEDQELDVVLALLAVARRIGAGVIVDVDASGGCAVVPDPDARVDLIVWAAPLISAAELLSQVRHVEPRAYLPADDLSFLYREPQSAPEADLRPADRAALHEQAWRIDAAAVGLNQPDPERFEVRVPLTGDSLLGVYVYPVQDIDGVRHCPSGLARYCYEVAWQPARDIYRFTDQVDEPMRLEREMAKNHIRAIVTHLAAALGGVTTNADGLRVDG
ncbi:MAG: hypothetical protein CSA58_05270 [Micrococcales bacterium]|nr:MAG: hypothetical protein CSA58_05270 [Micrococcales bacterium]